MGREIAGTVHEAQPAVQAATRWAAQGSRAEAPGAAASLGCAEGIGLRMPGAARSEHHPGPPRPCVCPVCSKAAAGGRAAEFRIGATLGALGRTAQGLLESALEGPRCAHGACLSGWMVCLQMLRKCRVAALLALAVAPTNCMLVACLPAYLPCVPAPSRQARRQPHSRRGRPAHLLQRSALHLRRVRGSRARHAWHAAALARVPPCAPCLRMRASVLEMPAHR